MKYCWPHFVISLLVVLVTFPVACYSQESGVTPLASIAPTVIVLSDGTTELRFANGVIKRIHPDDTLTVSYPSGKVTISVPVDVTAMANKVSAKNGAASATVTPLTTAISTPKLDLQQSLATQLNLLSSEGGKQRKSTDGILNNVEPVPPLLNSSCQELKAFMTQYQRWKILNDQWMKEHNDKLLAIIKILESALR